MTLTQIRMILDKAEDHLNYARGHLAQEDKHGAQLSIKNAIKALEEADEGQDREWGI